MNETINNWLADEVPEHDLHFEDGVWVLTKPMESQSHKSRVIIGIGTTPNQCLQNSYEDAKESKEKYTLQIRKSIIGLFTPNKLTSRYTMDELYNKAQQNFPSFQEDFEFEVREMVNSSILCFVGVEYALSRVASEVLALKAD